MELIKNKIYITEKNLVIGLVVFLGILFISYGYLVNATIVNIVERESFEYEAGELVAEVSKLEKKYGTLRSHITYASAHDRGFREPHKQVFATQKQIVGNISLE